MSATMISGNAAATYRPGPWLTDMPVSDLADYTQTVQWIGGVPVQPNQGGVVPIGARAVQTMVRGSVNQAVRTMRMTIGYSATGVWEIILGGQSIVASAIGDSLADAAAVAAFLANAAWTGWNVFADPDDDETIIGEATSGNWDVDWDLSGGATLTDVIADASELTQSVAWYVPTGPGWQLVYSSEINVTVPGSIITAVIPPGSMRFASTVYPELLGGDNVSLPLRVQVMQYRWLY